MTRCPYPPPDLDVDSRLAAELDHVPFTLKPGMDATCDDRLFAWLDAYGIRTLIIGGCTATSCVRVSSQAIKRKRPDINVVVDLSLSAARTANYDTTTSVFDPTLVKIYGADGCVGKSAVDLAVEQMRAAGVQVVDGFKFNVP